MAHTYVPSDDAILTVQDAAQRIKELERIKKESSQYSARLTVRVERLEYAAKEHTETISYLQGVALGMDSRFEKLEKKHAELLQFVFDLGGMQADTPREEIETGADVDTRAAELERTGAEDASEGSMWDAHQQYGR